MFLNESDKNNAKRIAHIKKKKKLLWWGNVNTGEGGGMFWRSFRLR